MPLKGVELAIPASEGPKTHALDHADTVKGAELIYETNYVYLMSG